MPTPLSEAYRWHWHAIRGIRLPITEEPECGWFLARTGRGAALPASISLVQEIDPETGELLNDEQFRCEILGEFQDPTEGWLKLARRPICKLEYMNRLAALF